MNNSIPKVWERDGNKKNPKIREREGSGKNPFPKFGNEKAMKKSITDVEEPEGNEKSIPTYQERESEAIIPRNSWELE